MNCINPACGKLIENQNTGKGRRKLYCSPECRVACNPPGLGRCGCGQPATAKTHAGPACAECIRIEDSVRKADERRRRVVRSIEVADWWEWVGLSRYCRAWLERERGRFSFRSFSLKK